MEKLNDMRFRIGVILLVFLLVLVLSAKLSVKAETKDVLKLSNPDASQYTKELFAYLRGMGTDEILFGHQHALDEGLTLVAEGNRAGSEESEVYHSVGSYPAVFGWDTNSLDGRERPGNAINDKPLTFEQRLNNLIKSMKKAHELGGIITLSMHPNNFVTGGDYGDTNGNVVKEILPGGSKHTEFNEWLDQIVELSLRLVDQKGEAIPIIFRPFHEQTGSWFWWGQGSTTPEEYKAIFRYTVEYLHEKGNDNFLIGYSPGAGPSGDRDRYFETYPGDAYVDILGIDNYDNKENAGSKDWIDSLAEDLHMLAEEADKREKVSALTEFGYSSTGINESGNHLTWWSDILDGIMNHPKYTRANETAYMLTWANFDFPNNVYVPYRDVNGDLGGDHELLPDFQKFHDDDRTIFAEIDQLYNQGELYSTKPHQPFMYVVAPVSGQTVTESEVILRTRVLNGQSPKVTYQIDGKEEVEMTNEGNYFKAKWIPTASENNKGLDVTYRYYENNNLVNEEIHRYFTLLEEVVIKEWTFDVGVDGVKNNGVYSDQESDVTLSTEHSSFNGGTLKLDVQNMDESQWWQELKLELVGIEERELQSITDVEYDVFVPVSAGEKEFLNVVMLPPKWDEKYESSIQLDKQFIKEIEGKEYYHIQVSIQLPTVEDIDGLALSLVGKQLNMKEPIYIDNITLFNRIEKVEKNPLLVDDFEGYVGDVTLLNKAYSKNGDPIELTLDTDHVVEGKYSLKYEYTIGSQGYAGRQKSLGGVDWSETNGISFWMTHSSQSNRHLTVQIQMGGVSFEADVDLDRDFEGMVEIPFTDFKPAHWETNQSATIDKERIQSVTQFALYMGGDRGEGTIYFDDIRATQIEGEPEIPAEPESKPNKERLKPIRYTFDESNEGFEIQEAELVDSHLRFPIQLHQKMEVKRSGIDLEGYKYMLARLKLDPNEGMDDLDLQTKLFIKTGDDWTWHESEAISISTSGYTEIVFKLDEVNNLSETREFGLGFAGDKDGTAIVYLDEVSFVVSLEDVEEREDLVEEDIVDEENGSDQENENDSQDDIGKKENNDSPDQSVESEKSPSVKETSSNEQDEANLQTQDSNKNNQLPNTATDIYKYLVIGFILSMIASLIMFIQKKRRI